MRRLAFAIALITPCMSYGAYKLSPTASTITISLSADERSPQYDLSLESLNSVPDGYVLKVVSQKSKRPISAKKAFANHEKLGGVVGNADILMTPINFTVKYDGVIHKAKGDVSFSNSDTVTDSFIYLDTTDKDVEISFE